MTQDPALFYKTHVFCCTNLREGENARISCAKQGSEELRSYMKKRAKELGIKDTRINTAGCLNRCELGPTLVIYPEGVWYSCKNKEDIEEVIQRHLIKGERVERLMLTPDQV